MTRETPPGLVRNTNSGFSFKTIAVAEKKILHIDDQGKGDFTYILEIIESINSVPIL